MSIRRTIGRKRDNDDGEEDADPFVSSWHVSSILAIVLPILTYIVVRVFSRGGQDDGGETDDQQEDGAENDGERRWSRWFQQGGSKSLSLPSGLVVFAYALSLLAFVTIVAFGHRVLTEERSSDTRERKGFWQVTSGGVSEAEHLSKRLGMLIGTVLMFGLLSFVLLVFSVASQMNSGKGFRGLGLIPSLGFLLWSIWSAVYSIFLLRARPSTESSFFRAASNPSTDIESAQPSSGKRKEKKSFKPVFTYNPPALTDSTDVATGKKKRKFGFLTSKKDKSSDKTTTLV